MSNKPTHTAYVVIDPREGSDRKAQWIEVGAVWPQERQGLRPSDPRRDQPLRPHRLPRAQGATGRIGLRPRRTVRRGFPPTPPSFRIEAPRPGLRSMTDAERQARRRAARAAGVPVNGTRLAIDHR